MKQNKVLSVVYGIALFVALLSVVALLYSAIETLSYTSFYETVTMTKYEPTKRYFNFQKPIAVALLVASVFGVVGVAAGVAYLFVKKPLFKIICLACVAVAVVAIMAALIAVCTRWNSCYKDYWGNSANNYPQLISGSLADRFAIYSAALASVIQNFVCFAVIAAALVYDFVKGVKDKKKEAAAQKVAAEEITE